MCLFECNQEQAMKSEREEGRKKHVGISTRRLIR